MRISNTQLRDFIKDSSLVKDDELEASFAEAERDKKKLGDVMLEKKLVDGIQLRKLYAYILGVPYVEISKEVIPREILQIIPEPIAKKYKIVAFEKSGHELKVAMLSPDDIQTIDFIRKKTGLRIVSCLTSEESIETVLKQYSKSLKAEFGDIISKNAEEISEAEDGEDEQDSEDLEKVAQGLPIIR
ncbi:MAG: hypothetical protein P4L58_00245, partial [Candidatus Pacebacteria bacterium]|nr:hypothetical protein [Candidatus Paceibacterota bacterium]